MVESDGDTPSPEESIGDLLLDRSLCLAVAESCTGGMISARITGVAGSSRYFRGGVVAYSNEVKRGLLSVSPETLGRFGAVSAETAAEMAQGVRERLGAQIGLSVTGIAGPAGGDRREAGRHRLYIGMRREECLDLQSSLRREQGVGEGKERREGH